MLNRMRRTSVRCLRQAGSLAQAAATALKEWRLQAIREASEAERLDRIRNPSKYLGKS
jgi:hypothetical protein